MTIEWLQMGDVSSLPLFLHFLMGKGNNIMFA